MAEEGDVLAPWLARWSLQSDGAAFTTAFGSRLAPVRHGGRAAMLKIAGHPEERDGGALMAWWAGTGAAEVLARDGEALLLERAMGGETLAARVRQGDDEGATAILCRVARGLHAPRDLAPPDTLKPLEPWFRALWPAAEAHGGPYARAAQAARDLFATPMPAVVLHGDLHHDNILDFGGRGWLAIDPKGLWGDRGYDYANLFCNPWPEADDPARLARRLAIAAEASGLARGRLLQWIIAYTGLSAAWTLGGGGDPWRALRIQAIAVDLA